MKTQSTTLNKISNETINLIEGVFSVSDSRDIINALLDEKINFHKLQRLKRTEGNGKDACSYDNNRLVELIDAKGKMQAYFNELQKEGRTIKLKSTIEISVEN